MRIADLGDIKLHYRIDGDLSGRPTGLDGVIHNVAAETVSTASNATSETGCSLARTRSSTSEVPSAMSRCQMTCARMTGTTI